MQQRKGKYFPAHAVLDFLLTFQNLLFFRNVHTIVCITNFLLKYI